MRENFKVVITNVKNNYSWYLSAHPTEELAKQKLREYALSNDFVMLTESKAESYDGQCRLFIFFTIEFMTLVKQIFNTKKQVNDFRSFLLKFKKGVQIEHVFFSPREKRYVIFWFEPMEINSNPLIVGR